MKRMLGAALALVAVPVLLASAANAAETAPQDLGVSITITETCAVSNIVPVAFGSQSSLANAVTAEGSVDVTCTNGTPYAISLDNGDGDGATAATRKMTGPASATVDYTLYPDNTYTTPWDNDEATVESTGTGSAQTHTIYGRVPTQSTPAPGAYTDTVAVIVFY